MALAFDELRSLLLLNRLAAGSPRRFGEMILGGITPAELLRQVQTEDLFGKAEALGELRDRFSPEREMEICDAKKIRLLTLLNEDYPDSLKRIFDPPLVLYMQGDWTAVDEAAVAVVGSRHPSFYGLTHAKKFSQALAAWGITIVSGLAQGIDQAAHVGALMVSHGRTLAVLGCGMDLDYPRGSAKLRAQIVERGAILSEYPLGTQPYAGNFPSRNRIIAGLSLGVLVVEAHARSGSLITAHEALEQGREVFAIPGPIDQLTSRGTHHLIKEGATLVESPEEILEVLASALGRVVKPLADAAQPELPLEAPRAEVTGLPFAPEEEQLLSAFQAGPLAVEELVQRFKMAPARLNGLLTRFELNRRIQKTPDGRFALMVKSS